MATSSTDELCQAFLNAQGLDCQPSNELGAALTAAIDVGEAAWPTLRSDRHRFAAFLGHRIPGDVNAIEALGTRAIAELFLVCGCLAGDPQASSCLEAHYLKELPALLARQGIALDLATETIQELRVRLLTGEHPLIAGYSGSGELGGWLRITATRAAIRNQRKQRDDLELDESQVLADAAGDPALQYQRKLYGDKFRDAFAEAIASLSIRERNLLKHSVLYGATSDDLGALYHVHRATAARWLADARDRLANETRRRMVDKLGIDRSEYDSILRLIQSQLDVSVARLLR